MSTPLIFGCFWVVASTIVAFMPLRRQFGPGIFLLFAAPVLVIWIAYVHGWWIAVAGLLAFLSMFRNPLRYLWKRARGLPVELPPELRDAAK